MYIATSALPKAQAETYITSQDYRHARERIVDVR
jgi:hypothetical protein